MSESEKVNPGWTVDDIIRHYWSYKDAYRDIYSSQADELNQFLSEQLNNYNVDDYESLWLLLKSELEL